MPTDEELKRFTKAEIKISKSLIEKNDKNSGGQNIKLSLNTVQPCIHLATGKAYIPGSSIKGLLRTAILYHLLQNNESVRNKFQDRLEGWTKRKGSIEDLAGIAESLEAELLYCLVDNKGNNRPLSLADALNGLRCSDAMPVGKVKTEVLQKIDLKLSKNGEVEESSMPLYRESILPGSEFTFSITLETAMMEAIGIYSVQDIIDIVTQYHNYVIHEVIEPAFFSAYSMQFLNLKGNGLIGSNTGFLYKTLFLGCVKSFV